MALLKEISTEYGIPATYWKITQLEFQLNKDCHVTISGYSNKDARLDNKQPLKVFEYTVVEGTLTNPINIADVYGYVKTQAEFVFNTIDDL